MLPLMFTILLYCIQPIVFASPLDIPSPPSLMDVDSADECSDYCMQILRQSIEHAILPDQSHSDRYHTICSKYDEAILCLESRSCEDNQVLNLLTSGVNYACREQGAAFSASIDCVDVHASSIQNECESECNTQEVFMKWVLRSGILKAPFGNMRSVDVHSTDSVDPSFGTFEENPMKAFASDVCSIGDCVLSCFKSKLNVRCSGSAGSLLSEALIRPFVIGQEKLASFGPLSSVFSSFVPSNCRFLVSGSELAKHRISPDLDESLKQLHSPKPDNSTTNVPSDDEFLSGNQLEEEIMAQYTKQPLGNYLSDSDRSKEPNEWNAINGTIIQCPSTQANFSTVLHKGITFYVKNNDKKSVLLACSKVRR